MPDQESIPRSDVVCDDSTSIIDGGALLHRVRWPKSKRVTFKDVVDVYKSYVLRHYPRPTVVFDGYEALSTKSNEHFRRNSIPMSSFVNIGEDIEIPFNQDRYFTLQENKVAFIQFLSSTLSSSGIIVVNCQTDADCEIVKRAIAHAKEGDGKIVVVADDTDIAVMLLYHWQDGMHPIYFLQERMNRAWSIAELQPSITDIKEHLLFIHAWSGCDTVSAIYGRGKALMVSLLRSSSTLKRAARLFTNPTSTQTDIGNAAVLIMKLMYGGSIDEALSKLRYSKYLNMTCREDIHPEKLSSTGIICPEKLPPTSRASFFHGLRTYHQVMLWSLNGSENKPDEWGWENTDNILTPIKTDLEVAPKSVRKVIRCNCKSLKNACSSRNCSCRKNNVQCISSCSGCHGEDCSNTESMTTTENLLDDTQSFDLTHEHSDSLESGFDCLTDV